MSEKWRTVGNDTLVSCGDSKILIYAHTHKRADLIVKAVNNHKPLVKALRVFADLYQKHHHGGPDDKPSFAINDAMVTIGDIRKAHALIAKIDREEKA